MRKIKLVSLGDYVLLSKYSDKDPQDPWVIGTISEYGVDNNRGHFYRVSGCIRRYRHVWKISQEEGAEYLKFYKEIGEFRLEDVMVGV